jgi:cytochrome c biogenesis protein CcdA
MQELLIAAFVGLSLGNSWLCLFMAFGFSTADLRTGLWFLAGRTVGLIMLGLIIIFAGMFLEVSPKLMQGIAGLLAVAFGTILVYQHREAITSKKTRSKKRGTKFAEIEVMNDGGGCVHPGKHEKGECKKHDRHMKGEMCNLKNEVREIEGSGKNRQMFGFGIGMLRGVTPCFKVVVLAPLMVAVSIGDALGMLLVFVGVSMVYPVIGYLSANTMHNLIANRKLMLVIGGLILIVMGLYYIYESIMNYGVHVPGA